jgi:hypothetical protein
MSHVAVRSQRPLEVRFSVPRRLGNVRRSRSAGAPLVGSVQAWMRNVCRMGSPTPAMSESVGEEGSRAGHQDRQQLGPSVMGTGVARDSEARGPEEGMSPRLGGGARR